MPLVALFAAVFAVFVLVGFSVCLFLFVCLFVCLFKKKKCRFVCFVLHVHDWSDISRRC